MSRQTAAAKESEHPAGLLVSAQSFRHSAVTACLPACPHYASGTRVSMLLVQFRPMACPMLLVQFRC